MWLSDLFFLNSYKTLYVPFFKYELCRTKILHTLWRYNYYCKYQVYDCNLSRVFVYKLQNQSNSYVQIVGKGVVLNFLQSCLTGSRSNERASGPKQTTSATFNWGWSSTLTCLYWNTHFTNPVATATPSLICLTLPSEPLCEVNLYTTFSFPSRKICRYS